jgi:hypothetical protein
MKKIFIVIFLLTNFSLAAKDAKVGLKTTDSIAGKQAQHFELISLLISKEKVSLKGMKNCENFFKSNQDNVGRFMAWSLSFYIPRQDNSIEVHCEKQKNNEICSLIFYTDSKGESPWACGLRFLYESKKGIIQDSSFECIGSC